MIFGSNIDKIKWLTSRESGCPAIMAQSWLWGSQIADKTKWTKKQLSKLDISICDLCKKHCFNELIIFLAKPRFQSFLINNKQVPVCLLLSKKNIKIANSNKLDCYHHGFKYGEIRHKYIILHYIAWYFPKPSQISFNAIYKHFPLNGRVEIWAKILTAS